MIIGVDRLDYTKGLETGSTPTPNSHDQPELHEQVFLLPDRHQSREDVDTYQEIRPAGRAIGRINGDYATMDWVPVRYVNASHRRDELAGLTGRRRLGWSRRCATA
jgi:trehalose 6-phosphate synthase